MTNAVGKQATWITSLFSWIFAAESLVIEDSYDRWRQSHDQWPDDRLRWQMTNEVGKQATRLTSLFSWRFAMESLVIADSYDSWRQSNDQWRDDRWPWQMTNYVGKQAKWLTPSLVGDTQWNHWLKKTSTAHMFNRLCYSTLYEIIRFCIFHINC